MSVLPNGGVPREWASGGQIELHSMMSVLPNGGGRKYRLSKRERPLHSMMSVLPNGGVQVQPNLKTSVAAALDDVSATEWRRKPGQHHSRAMVAAALDDVSATEWRSISVVAFFSAFPAALDDVSATEWRLFPLRTSACVGQLHSMMSVLPNGGPARAAHGSH